MSAEQIAEYTSLLVFDLDGTLANVDHRQEHALNKDWEVFHSLCHLDQPYRNIAELFAKLAECICVIILTGRDEKYRAQTEQWLCTHGITPDALYMRPADDFTKDGALKLRMIDEICGGREAALAKVTVWFEDRDQVVEELRNAGFTVAQVRAGAY